MGDGKEKKPLVEAEKTMEEDTFRGRRARGGNPQSRPVPQLVGDLFNFGSADLLFELYGIHGCSHRGEPVQVGPYTILAGGTRDFQLGDMEKAELLVPLHHGFAPLAFGKRYQILAAPLKDFGGVPDNWAEFLKALISELESGKRVLAFCVGSHGRTGTLIASLIALLEPETRDPIAAARERHCTFAVETIQQAEGIFKLRDQTVPRKYVREFTRHLHGIPDDSKLSPPQPDPAGGRKKR